MGSSSTLNLAGLHNLRFFLCQNGERKKQEDCSCPTSTTQDKEGRGTKKSGGRRSGSVAAEKEKRKASRLRREVEVQEVIISNLSPQKMDDPYGNNRIRRWRKCDTMGEDLVQHLHSPDTRLSVCEKKETLRRFWLDPQIQDLLPPFL